MALCITNTMSGKKEPFVPLTPGTVNMYVCGVTVYDQCHIGHARALLTFDVIHRYLRFLGFDCRFVRNFTDVDDKIINRANEEGTAPEALAQRYIDEFHRDAAALGLAEPTVEPRATEHIDGMIALIAALVERGHAYAVAGDVYFAVESFPEYGRLSSRSLDEMTAGARVEVDDRKRHPMDFALWKAGREGEPFWDSPWGGGRPGWHIECSVMCLHHLGESIDIHGGGNDLIFPHHENEIAQSESLTGKPFARYWIHNGMLQLSGEKMSKSIGNLVTIDSFLEQYSADALRMLIFSGHYRKPVSYSDESIGAAVRSTARLRGGLRPATGTVAVGEEVNGLREVTESARSGFRQAMDDDFNTSLATAHLFELVRAINTARAAGVSGPFFHAAQDTLRELAGVLGLSLTEAAGSDGDVLAAKPFIDLLVSVRTELRQKKEWEMADQVREGLVAHSVQLEDTPNGTTWRIEATA